ncbi:MAG: FoF1 ATP synthase subunit gamma [Nannocystaceae bacterium]
MKRERELDQRLRSLETLGDAISAMKSLSAHHFRETREALQSARGYREGIDRVLLSTGARLPAGHGACGLLVLGAELGMCGSYNSQVGEAAARRREQLGDGPTLCVGRRASTLLARRGVRIDRIYSAPTSVRGVPQSLMRVAQDMLSDYVERDLRGWEVASCRFEGVGSHIPRITSLLPVDLRPRESAKAVRYVDPGRAATIAVRELLYVSLHDLLLDAMASEHGARLLATQSAEHWLRERATRMRRFLAAARREASTQEVIEIAAGARARRR